MFSILHNNNNCYYKVYIFFIYTALSKIKLVFYMVKTGAKNISGLQKVIKMKVKYPKVIVK